MCGIAGYIILKDKKVRPKVMQGLARGLLEQIESRGKEATGYAYVSVRDKHAYVAKAPVPASEFIKIDGHLLSQQDIKLMPRTMILHTRYATKGNPSNNENNHPVFSKRSGLCMVHNGWLVNDEELAKEHKLKLDATVDSETYLRLIEKAYYDDANRNVTQSIMSSTKLVLGSIACAMIQGKYPGKLWLWRHTGPLSLVQTDFGYVFASERDMLFRAVFGNTRSIDVSWIKPVSMPQSTLLEINEEGPIITHDIAMQDFDGYQGNRQGYYRSFDKGNWTVRKMRHGTVTYTRKTLEDSLNVDKKGSTTQDNTPNAVVVGPQAGTSNGNAASITDKAWLEEAYQRDKSAAFRGDDEYWE